MSKATITRLFVVAVLAVAAGLAVGLATVVAALAGGVVQIGGPGVVDFDGGALAGALPWLVVASLAIASGSLVALASWIGALLNTARLDDKAWFIGLLVLGLVSLGWIAMVAYVVAGPDRTRPRGIDGGVASAGGS